MQSIFCLQLCKLKFLMTFKTVKDDPSGLQSVIKNLPKHIVLTSSTRIKIIDLGIPVLEKYQSQDYFMDVAEHTVQKCNHII
ncbi:hypothetical protein B9T34_17050 [Acinetobacter sp. ANC 3813]|nr:hypothetical protein B9T34_17050 [Acinetobacter sp. ANC 3813]